MKQKQVRRRLVSIGRYRPFILSDETGGTGNAASVKVLSNTTSASASSAVAIEEKVNPPAASVSNNVPPEASSSVTLPVVVGADEEHSPPISIGDRLHNVTSWLIFSVLVALLPIILVTISLPLHRLPVTFENTLSHGELLLVSTAILGEAIGDLILNRKANRFLKVVIVGLNVVVFGIACYLFADILRTAACSASSVCSASNPDVVIDENVNALYSYSVFVWTFFSGLSCKLAVEK